MHEQCLEKNMVEHDQWNCPICRACLKHTGYTRLSKSSRGSVQRSFIKRDFWRDQHPPPTENDQEDDGELRAALAATHETEPTESGIGTSSTHNFLFWDGVTVNRGESSLHNEEELPAEEDGCVLEVTELQVRVLIYRIMQSEWFSHSDVKHSAGQAAYWEPPHQEQLQHTQLWPPATGVPEILDDLA